MTVLLVLLGGALGASLRYLTELFVQARHDHLISWAFPWGTFTVNIVGSLIAGVTAGAVGGVDGPEWVLTLVVTGFFGALTTFSTFGFETVRLIEEGSLRTAGLNVGASIVVGFAAAAGGWSLATVIA